MSKKFRESLKAMSADQVTEKLGDMCEKQDRILTDKNKGLVRALFNGGATVFLAHRGDLVDVAVVKNDVTVADLVDHYASEDDVLKGTLRAIATAAERRGSKSAVKIRAYLELHDKIDQKKAEMGVNDLSYTTASQSLRSTIKEVKIWAKARKAL